MEYRVYKANKAGTGFAIKLSTSLKGDKYKKLTLFLEGAAQTGIPTEEDDNSSFGWPTKEEKFPEGFICCKLGLADVGAIIGVLRGITEFVGSAREKGLFHKNETGNTVINFAANEKGGCSLGLSAQRNGKLTKGRVALTVAECEVIRLFLEKFVGAYFDGN